MAEQKSNVLSSTGQRTLRTKAFLTNFFKALKKKKSLEDALPPPIPPKEPPTLPKGNKGIVAPIPLSHFQRTAPPSRTSQDHAACYRRSRSLSDFAEITHSDADDNTSEAEPRKLSSQLYTLPLKGKWAQEAAVPMDRVERDRRRRELQLKREQEEQQAIEEEQKRQQKIKTEKENLLKQEEEEKRQRKLEVEREISRIREEKRRREEIEREEEERKHRELEERKRQNRDRRMEEHRRLEQWREEHARRTDAAAQRAEEIRRSQEHERRKRIQEAASKLQATKEESDLTGWMTMLNKESLAWKRRYYKFVGNTILFYRDKKVSGNNSVYEQRSIFHTLGFKHTARLFRLERKNQGTQGME